MTSTFSANLEYWPLDRLIPHARNARTHSEAQVAQIAGSIAEFSFVNPVLVGDDGVIVAGHGRVLAARKLGLSEAPVIVLAHLSPTQRRALMIADNRIAENAGWDDELLAAELAALRDEDVELGLLGFDEAELDRLLDGSAEENEDADAAPDAATTRPQRAHCAHCCQEMPSGGRVHFARPDPVQAGIGRSSYRYGSDERQEQLT
jgi:ParB-like chromosome segregation protein Spo0J